MKRGILSSCNTIVLLVLSVLSGCTGSSQGISASGDIHAGPLKIGISITDDGGIFVSGGLAPKISVGLGPIGLEVGIQKTIELTEQKSFYLFIVWEEPSGEVRRDEYEIGKEFQVDFDRQELVQQIKGDNNSIVVVAKRGGSILAAERDIQANDPEGITYTIDKPGRYEIAYDGGTYSTGPLEQGGKQWRTVIHIYKRPEGILWGGEDQYNEPTNPKYALGCRADQQPTNEQTQVTCAKNTSFTAQFEQGETLVFVAVDDKGSYGDNRGTVHVKINRIVSP